MILPFPPSPPQSDAAGTALTIPTPFPSAVGGKGEAFLRENSRRAYVFFVEQADPGTGLVKDRARNFGPDSPEHTVASIAATGYALTAYAVGVERGWMTKAEATGRTKRVLRTLARQYRHKGWFYHWLDARTAARAWKSEISTIDSALLFDGLIVARQRLKDPEIDAAVDRILQGVDFRAMLTDDGARPKGLALSMGWRPEEGYLKAQWDHVFENLALNVLALGLDPKLPTATWDALKRPVLRAEGREVLVGGNLFMHQMSHGYLDFRGRRDRLGYDYWIDGRNMTLAQQGYAARNPKGYKGWSADLWGFSASDVPGGYGGTGFPSYEGGDPKETDGTLAPPSALASAIFTPAETLAAAEAFYRAYPNAYGRYGFSSGLNPTRGWRGPDVIGIDQGQAMINIENARDGLVQRLFTSYPPVRLGLARAGFRITRETGDRPLKR